MKLRYLSVLSIPALLLAVNLASAAELVIPPVLPQSVAERLLANDPALSAASASLAAANIAAQQTTLSPYDWVARGTYQRRDYQGSDSKVSNEWNIGVERSVRLPGKRRADEASAEASQLIAPLQYQQTRRSVAEGLLNAWFDWLDADARKTLLQRQQATFEANVAAVAKRVKGGDAARLELSLANAELTTFQREVNAANYAEAQAWSRLTARYQANNDLKAGTVPDPVAIPQSETWWQTYMLAANAPLQLARAQVIQAAAEVQRAKAERQPDPTFGVFTGSEAYGHERLIGVTASIPIGGKRRGLEIERQLALENSSRINLTLTEREQRAAILSSYNNAQGSYERWQLARQSALTMADNATLTQKAYSLGEGDVQLLLLARRQALSAALDEASSKVAALRSYYQLLLDAQLLWPDWLNQASR